MGGYDISGPLVLLGSIFGVGYALLGIGLVLAYRSSGFINFAHGATGLLPAAMMAVVVNDYGVPYWLGFIGAMIVGALLAAAIEAVVVRKLASAPKVLAMVATLGTAQALLLLALSFSGGGLGGGSFPQPPLLPDFDLSAYVSPSASGLLILSPFLVGGLYLFLNRSRYGVAIRGAASNPDAATLAGADPQYMAMLSWALAGAIAAFAAMLILPNQSTVTPDTLGPDFIVRGLAVAVLARFSSLPIAFGAGIAIGVLEQVIATNPDATGYFEVVLFVLILVGVALQSRSNRDEQEQWDTLASPQRLPDSYRNIWLIRNFGWVVGGVAAGIGILLPLWISNQSAFILSTVVGFAIIGLSVSFLTGLGGQLSLGQVGFAAIGGVVAVRLSVETGSMLLGLVCGGLAAAAASAAVGLPALRVQGQLLAIATLAFGLATFSWLLRQDWMLGTGLSSRPLSIFGVELGTARGFFYVALGAYLVVLAVASVARNSSFGRTLVAVRDNRSAARVFRIAPRRVTLQAYGMAGFIAGIGGGILAFSNTFVTRAIFTPTAGINAVSIAVIGGLAELSGALLGAAYLIGIPAFLELELAALAGLNAAWLILILEQPKGISGLLASTRGHLFDVIARWHGVDPVEARAEQKRSGVETEGLSALPLRAAESDHSVADRPLLQVGGVSKRFGAVNAVDDVSFDVASGETLGLIGPNGAGKTTLFEIVSGYVRPDSGTIRFEAADITGLAPEARSRLGLVRSFQNASLFPTMTPRDIIIMAHNHAVEQRLVLAGSRQERAIEAEAMETIDLFGLGEIADRQVYQLSTGTRRIVELAANVSLRPRLLLLDEPSAGIAQAETEALGRVIEQIRDNYSVTIVVIEHDMPLLTGICDRMIAMAVGEVIAEGTPAEVQAAEAVIVSYLGTDSAAIARSGSV
ncbi:MAG: ABC transporter permease subunit [Acidimicrobiales bacterium]